MSSYTDSLIAHDFLSFARQCHKICRSGETLDNDPYLLRVFAMAEDIADGRVPKAAISMPPGTAESAPETADLEDLDMIKEYLERTEARVKHASNSADQPKPRATKGGSRKSK